MASAREMFSLRYKLSGVSKSRKISEVMKMGGIKVEHTFELNDDHVDWLKEMTEKYALEDEGKALRIVLDYVNEEADQTTVFEEIRCNHCD
jgi:hypothetical protein